MSAIRRRPLILGLLTILALAGIWRGVMAVRLPVIARDGVTFCRHARLLGERGVEYLRDPAFQQHPLFPLLILGAQRTARLCGAADAPFTWQYSGQVICWLSGMAVIVLTAALSGRLVQRLGLPVDRGHAMLIAGLLASVSDLNVWLSADVMSDQMHLAFYLAAVLLLLHVEPWWAAPAIGLLSGLAFLTREEGFVPAAAGLVALLAARKTWSRPVLLGRIMTLLVGFLVLVGPYWAAVGKFSPKKNPLDWFDNAAAIGVPQPLGVEAPVGGRIVWPPTAAARLETLDLPWYALLPHVLYVLLRAGRVVVPLLALPPVFNLRARLTRYPLIGWTCCLAGHLFLATLLLALHGYLSPRHMLVPVALLTPLAAMLLARLYRLLTDLHRPWWGRAAVGAALLPLALYALRVPNSGDAYLRDAVDWLQSRDAGLSSKRLLSGSSAQRLAFYANMRWEYWPEQPEEYDALARQIRHGGGGYFAIEVGPGFERAGNQELVARLRADGELARYLGEFHERSGPIPDVKLLLIELKDAPGDPK